MSVRLIALSAHSTALAGRHLGNSAVRILTALLTAAHNFGARQDRIDAMRERIELWHLGHQVERRVGKPVAGIHTRQKTIRQMQERFCYSGRINNWNGIWLSAPFVQIVRVRQRVHEHNRAHLRQCDERTVSRSRGFTVSKIFIRCFFRFCRHLQRIDRHIIAPTQRAHDIRPRDHQTTIEGPHAN